MNKIAVIKKIIFISVLLSFPVQSFSTNIGINLTEPIQQVYKIDDGSNHLNSDISPSNEKPKTSYRKYKIKDYFIPNISSLFGMFNFKQYKYFKYFKHLNIFRHKKSPSGESDYTTEDNILNPINNETLNNPTESNVERSENSFPSLSENVLINNINSTEDNNSISDQTPTPQSIPEPESIYSLIFGILLWFFGTKLHIINK